MIKIEIGKSYITTGGFKYKILSEYKEKFVACLIYNCDDILRFVDKQGVVYNNTGTKMHSTGTILKEWKEPTVHRRDVVWFKNGTDVIYCDTFVHGYTFGDHILVLKRETVEYIEE